MLASSCYCPILGNINSREASADNGKVNESTTFLVVGIAIAGVVVIGICGGAVAFCCCAGRSEQMHKAATNNKPSVIVEVYSEDSRASYLDTTGIETLPTTLT